MCLLTACAQFRTYRGAASKNTRARTPARPQGDARISESAPDAPFDQQKNTWRYAIPRHFLGQADISPDELSEILTCARDLKAAPFSAALASRSLVMLFEKPSTRTRLSFEIGMTQLGGHAVYLDRDSAQLSRGESLEDTARVVSRYADALMARVDEHSTLERLAHAATIPVVNGLSDREHPCQTLADLLTILEHRDEVRNTVVAYLGDGNNNVTHSLMIGVAQLGGSIVAASPAQLAPAPEFVEQARAIAKQTGGSVRVVTDAEEAAKNADVVYTDVWISMGQDSAREMRQRALAPYQVNGGIMALARPGAIFMHCLPAHAGEEVTEEVAYGPQSVIFDQAENRLHAQKALVLKLLEWSQGGHE